MSIYPLYICLMPVAFVGVAFSSYGSCELRWDKSFVILLLLYTPVGVLEKAAGSLEGACICHLHLGLVPWWLTQIIPLGQCQAPPQNYTAAVNRLVWWSIQTLKPKQSWQLSTRTNILMHKAHAKCQDGSVCHYLSVSACNAWYVLDFSTLVCKLVSVLLCVGPSTIFFSCFGTAYPQLWLNPDRFPDSVQARRLYVKNNLPHWQKSLPVGDLSWRGNQRLTWQAGLPPSWQKSLVSWLGSTHFAENHSTRCSCLLQCSTK